MEFIFRKPWVNDIKRGNIQKRDISDDAQPTSNDGEFISMAEMPNDVLLLSSSTRRNLERHESISYLMRGSFRVTFAIRLEFVDKSIKRFGIIFEI